MNKRKYPQGDAFVREKTGSAPLINLDGESDYRFPKDRAPAHAPAAVKKKPANKLSRRKNDAP